MAPTITPTAPDPLAAVLDALLADPASLAMLRERLSHDDRHVHRCPTCARQEDRLPRIPQETLPFD
jgi:hypothetical protein